MTDDTLNAFLESSELAFAHGLVDLLVIGGDACTIHRGLEDIWDQPREIQISKCGMYR